MLKIENELGHLNIEKNAIGRIVSEAVAGFGGEVYLSNKKGKPLKLKNPKGFADHSPEMDIRMDGDSLHVEFYIIMRFGTSIKETAAKLFDNIRSDLSAIFGIENVALKLTVTGMYTRDIKNIAKRSVEVSR